MAGTGAVDEVKPNNGEAYNAQSLRKPINVADIGSEGTALYKILGTDLNRRGNLALIEDDMLIYVGGNAVIFEDTKNSVKEFLLCIDDGGVGCVAVHPSRKLFAVGGKGFQPNIYIYSYPERQIMNVLRGGAERGYASLTFNKGGDKMASVSMSPDFMLTVWDWELERVALHAKAFGQDVFSVRFSLDDERRLTTCGTGHIRFWKLAATFTGLKLQGSIGKFGKVELSDIAAFVECPDGKVISGTENGSILLWEGNFIKCRFVRAGGEPCHDGEITYVELDREERRLVTASTDGFIRWWNFDIIDSAEVDSDNSIDFELTPATEYYLGDGRGVKMMVDGGIIGEARTFYVVDTAGCSQSIYFWLGEEPEEVTRPGLVKRRSIRDIVVVNPVKKIRRLSMVIADMVPEFKNLPPKVVPVPVVMRTEKKEKKVKSESEKEGDEGKSGKDGDETETDDENSSSEKGAGEEIPIIQPPLSPSRIPIVSPLNASYAIKPVTKTLSDFHAGMITGMDTSPSEHIAISCGKDGSVRCWDYVSGHMMFCCTFDCPAMSLKWVPLHVDPSGQTVVVGFSNGIIRVLRIVEYDIGEGYKEFRRTMVFKPHNAPVVDVSFSDTSTLFASTGGDGTVFFFDIRSKLSLNHQWIPLKFVRLLNVTDQQNKNMPHTVGHTVGHSALVCESITWRQQDGKDIAVCSCSDGVLREYDVSSLVKSESELKQTADLPTFEAILPMAERIVRVPLGFSCAIVPVVLGAVAKANSSLSATVNIVSSKDLLAPVDAEEAVPQYVSVRVSNSLCLPSLSGNMVAGAAWGNKFVLLHSSTEDETYATEFATGPYSFDGKESLKTSLPSCIRFGWSGNYLISGSMDGSVTIRPVASPAVFVRFVGHNNAIGGVSACAVSFDDNYAISAGRDGVLVVHRIRRELIDRLGAPLVLDIEAGIFNTQTTKTIPVHKESPEPMYLNRIFSDQEKNNWSKFSHEKGMRRKAGVEVYQEVTEELVSLQVMPPSGAMPEGKSEEKKEKKEGEDKKDEDKKSQTEEKDGGKSEKVSEPEPIPDLAPSIPDMNQDAGFLEVEAKEIPEGAYSIEDAKLKSGEDAKEIAAEELKEKVRQSVRLLRRDYKEAVKLNMALPLEVMLSNTAMSVDGDFLITLQTQGQELLEEVHKECAYEAEKAEKLRKKITNRLMNGILVREMPLYGFNMTNRDRSGNPRMVKSLRTQGVDPEVKKILDEVHANVVQEELLKARNKSSEAAQARAHQTVVEHNDSKRKEDDPNNPNKDEANSSGKGGDIPIVRKGVEKAVPTLTRREMRKQRKADLTWHCDKKPGENDDDVRDNTAIKLAEKTIGDYKLKVADDYEILEESRVNATKKKSQMALLEDSMVSMRLQFNERFLSLRELKRQIVYAVRRDNMRVRDIDSELLQQQLSANLWEPLLDPSEYPDDFDEVTPDELESYKKTRVDHSWGKALAPPHTVITGGKTKITRFENHLGGLYDTTQKDLFAGKNLKSSDDFLYDPLAMIMTPKRNDAPKYYELVDSVLSVFSKEQSVEEQERVAALEKCLPVLMLARNAMKLKDMPVEKSEFLTPAQSATLQERKKKLEFERKMLCVKTETNVEAFEEALEQLRVDRHCMLADLKLAELKLLVMFQEYKMLKTYELKDIALQQRQKKCVGEKNEITGNMTEYKLKLDVKVDDAQIWNEKIASVSTDLKAILPDSHLFADILNKIFKKKIKRNKAGGAEEDEEEEEEDDDDEDDEDEEEVEDYCPAGCDRALYDRVIEFRERRLDYEEVILEIQKGIDDLKKTMDRLKQREKQIVKEALQAEVEVQQFQLQKQATLNQIGIVVPLKLSQLYAFQGSGSLTGPTDVAAPAEGIPPTGASFDSAEITDPAAVAAAADLSHLLDFNQRLVVPDINLYSHVLFNNKAMIRLQNRIGELHLETDEERINLKEMHKERVRLNKYKEVRQGEIALWENKCKNIQMLKFGRMVDVDALEAGSDRSKEIEAEKTVKVVEDDGRIQLFRMQKELEDVQEKLAFTTLKNTEMLNAVANLTEMKLSITRELNTSKGPTVTEDSKQKEYREKEERKRMQMYLQLQAREISALKAELTMLKRKDVPPLPTMIPQSSYNQNQDANYGYSTGMNDMGDSYAFNQDPESRLESDPRPDPRSDHVLPPIPLPKKSNQQIPSGGGRK